MLAERITALHHESALRSFISPSHSTETGPLTHRVLAEHQTPIYIDPTLIPFYSLHFLSILPKFGNSPTQLKQFTAVN